jgi:multidrug resistance efflux pump
MVRRKPGWIFSMAVSFFLLTLLAACSPSSTDSSALTTGRVTAEILTDSVETSGTLEAKQFASMVWGTSGVVEEIKVSNQDKVTSGEELLKLDPATAPTEVLNAISELVTAKQSLKDLQLSNTGLAEAYQTLVDARIAYEDAREQYLMVDDPIAPEDFTASLKLAYIDAQKATERALRAYNQYGDNPESYDDESYYPKFAAYTALCQARINEADALTRLNHFSNPLTKVLADLVVGEYNLAKSTLDEAQRNYDEINAGM